MTDPSSTSLVEERLKLWFFRECNPGTRRHLFAIFGMPLGEIRSLGEEQHAFNHILKALRSTSPELRDE